VLFLKPWLILLQVPHNIELPDSRDVPGMVVHLGFLNTDGSHLSIEVALADDYTGAGLRAPNAVVFNPTRDNIVVKIGVNTLVIHIDTLAFTSCTVARL
jgi:hypothetical protein